MSSVVIEVVLRVRARGLRCPEGELTEAQIRRLQAEATELMIPEEDSVIFYELGSEKYVGRMVLGLERGERTRIL